MSRGVNNGNERPLTKRELLLLLAKRHEQRFARIPERLIALPCGTRRAEKPESEQREPVLQAGKA